MNFGADYIEPGVIHYGGRGAVVVGEIDGRTTPRVSAIHDAWLAFDDRAVVTPNVWGYLWGKEAHGAMLFATALSNESIADALAMPAYRASRRCAGSRSPCRRRRRRVVPEAFDGFDPASFTPSARRGAATRSLDALVAHNRKSAKTHSGIWRDLAVRKRRTEVDAQLGPIVVLGQDVGVATPLIARLVELIHDVESGARTQSLDTLDALIDTSVVARG